PSGFSFYISFSYFGRKKQQRRKQTIAQWCQVDTSSACRVTKALYEYSLRSLKLQCGKVLVASSYGMQQKRGRRHLTHRIVANINAGV
ncbi:unnamed protein product, partial [Ceratitis capitata]